MRDTRAAPGTSQDERFTVKVIVAIRRAGEAVARREQPEIGDQYRLVVNYMIDNDFNSQSDKTETRLCELRLQADGQLVAIDVWELQDD